MDVADMRLSSVVHVPSDVADYVATDAIIDVQGVHTNPETVIASVAEDILQEDGEKIDGFTSNC